MREIVYIHIYKYCILKYKTIVRNEQDNYTCTCIHIHIEFPLWEQSDILALHICTHRDVCSNFVTRNITQSVLFHASFIAPVFSSRLPTTVTSSLIAIRSIEA